MKRLTMAALLAGQMLAAAPPALAAELTDGRTQEMGAFGGVRLRVPLDGGAAEQRQVRAGLAVAPTLRSRSASGETRTRIGEGLELGFNGDDRVRLSLAGTPVSHLARGPAGPDGRRLGVSTLGWIAIGTVVVAGAVLVLFQLCVDGEVCGSDRDG